VFLKYKLLKIFHRDNRTVVTRAWKCWGEGTRRLVMGSRGASEMNE
jgi:hypothetical protein